MNSYDSSKQNLHLFLENKKTFNFPKIKVPIFQHNVVPAPKMGENQIWDLQYAPTKVLSMRTAMVHSSESVISQLLEIWFPILSERNSTSFVFKGLLFLHVSIIRKPTFPWQGSIRAWVGEGVFRFLAVSHSGSRHSLCVVHNGLATHTQEPSTDPEVSHPCIRFCQIRSFLSDCILFGRLCRCCQIVSFFVWLCQLLSELSCYPHWEPYQQRYYMKGILAFLDGIFYCFLFWGKTTIRKWDSSCTKMKHWTVNYLHKTFKSELWRGIVDAV